MSLSIASGTSSTVELLNDLFPADALKSVGFRLWDGTAWPAGEPRAATLVLKHPGALREMFAGGTEKALAEAFMRGDFEIDGDLESAFELADLVRERAHEGWLTSLKNYYRLRTLPARPREELRRTFTDGYEPPHSLQRDRRAVSFHYDLSNDFYKLWLDRRMVYSCAYFERPDLGLDEAQEAKLRHLCRKLRLRPGQRLLDIGCGWGGLSRFAAEHYGVRVVGLTLSREQQTLALARARSEGLEDRVEIRLQDYREIAEPGAFDAIVSVGMSEHVGAQNLPAYFQAAAALLRPRGVFLNHAIGEGIRPANRGAGTFMDDYIFPDGEIPPIPVVGRAAESAGLEIRDVENLREHYALTLRHWLRRLETAHDEARRIVDEPTFRAWRLYLAGSAHGFERSHLAIYQTLLSKPDARGVADLPLTRRDWYGEA